MEFSWMIREKSVPEADVGTYVSQKPAYVSPNPYAQVKKNVHCAVAARPLVDLTFAYFRQECTQTTCDAVPPLPSLAHHSPKRRHSISPRKRCLASDWILDRNQIKNRTSKSFRQFFFNEKSNMFNEFSFF